MDSVGRLRLVLHCIRNYCGIFHLVYLATRAQALSLFSSLVVEKGGKREREPGFEIDETVPLTCSCVIRLTLEGLIMKFRCFRLERK